MGDPRGFLKLGREKTLYREVCERVKDFKDVSKMCPEKQSQEQASRCMDCATPFCHWGCPVGNYIPEWNDYMFKGKWEAALDLLQATNNLPEITGRLCPALCEYACVLGLTDDPVTIRENELSIIEYAFKESLIKPKAPKIRTGKKIAVIGSGPAGLSCAGQLNKAGHSVTVFEKDDKVGGILRYGIPDFKLEKKIIERRVKILEKEGIKFKTGLNVGPDYPISKLKEEFDAICIAIGSRIPRDLTIEGRELKGIYFAMDYLMQSNCRVSGEKRSGGEPIDAKGKKVLVIGGGDTGADCVGTAHRQGASCVVQIEVLPKPSECRTASDPWPRYPFILKTSTSHEEGGERHWAVLTKRFIGEKGCVKKVSCVKIEFSKENGKNCQVMKEIPGTEFEIEADLVILAIGFMHPERGGLLNDLGLELDNRGNIKTDEKYITSIKNIFSAGDARRGQSLIVWAISEGRRSAYCIDKYLIGESNLPSM
ncbi:MAG: glutamate synthase [Candidatus Omnitrophica bacterium CG07_land_8_20_14_0_80_42_15]|uniref:Glutamate synthase n=1 Tax=Candidatus Aquitaenariimonas noxiae TaxID=1974741 RepID=A0A2J0KR83_9BACT|nr:MAG: glutamate synthase [Candidatus Omnitrophica bacterium CG07_land_8_20_14_0_80_42_15]